MDGIILSCFLGKSRDIDTMKHSTQSKSGD
uniref:Uncharacterized protein n=1 Tax=Rhizophora mucronata TaxID=61149 RepID=A0A2P2Q050_RHIMU